MRRLQYKPFEYIEGNKFYYINLSDYLSCDNMLYSNENEAIVYCNENEVSPNALEINPDKSWYYINKELKQDLPIMYRVIVPGIGLTHSTKFFRTKKDAIKYANIHERISTIHKLSNGKETKIDYVKTNNQFKDILFQDLLVI